MVKVRCRIKKTANISLCLYFLFVFSLKSVNQHHGLGSGWWIRHQAAVVSPPIKVSEAIVVGGPL